MGTKDSLFFAVLATIGVGVLGVTALHAQLPSATKAPAFYITEVEVTDPESLRPYRERVNSTLEPFGGRYIVLGGDIAPLEGDAPKGRIVVIAFDSMEKARGWYDSPAYQEIKPIRQKAAKSRAFIVGGKAN